METTCENMLLHQQSIVNLTLMKMLTPSYKQIITCIYYRFKVIIIIILYFLNFSLINKISPSLSIYLSYPKPALQNAVAIFTCGSAIWYIIYLLPPSLRDHQPNGSRYIFIICKNVSAYMLKTNNKILEQI